MKNKLILILIACIILIIGVLIWIKIQNSILDKDGMVNHRAHELIGVSYESSGSMNGERLYLELAPDKQGKLIFTMEYTEPFGKNEKKVSFEADPEDIEPIREICKATNALILGKLKLSDIQELDGAVETVIFYLENQTIEIDSMHEVPSTACTIFNDIKTVLMNMIVES